MSTPSIAPPPAPQTVRSRLGPCLHRGRSAVQADLYALTGEAAGWILKDFSARPWWARVLVARRAMRREIRALEALRALDGIPRFGGRVGPDAFLMGKLDAERLPHRRDNFLTPRFFERLEELIDRVHASGWAHGDLRRKNILVDRDLNPYLIDFATAFHAGARAGCLRRWLFGRWAQVDRVSVVRIKHSYLPDALSARDLELLARQPFHIRAGRWIRKRVYRPLKKRHRRKFVRWIAKRIGLGKRSA